MIGVERNFGGAEGNRTPDPLHAMQMRYQLRYSPYLNAHKPEPLPPINNISDLRLVRLGRALQPHVIVRGQLYHGFLVREMENSRHQKEQ